MEIVWIVLGSILVIVGVLGCILPIIPGPPITYSALLLLQLTGDSISRPFTTEQLLLWGFITVLVTVLDYVVPIWGTKRFGGSKWGTWGSAIGLVFGLFLGPIGIIIGPFIGAVVGELLHGIEVRPALRAGFGSFIGFLMGVMMKLIVSIWMAVLFVKESVQYFVNL
ncbi:MAG: DUF456 domain-containing protein [Bacteroidales bacterium]|nr:DUF456 domain-containing protein [Bacteroidales bacterium]